MRKDGLARIQHYVPQFLLRKFLNPKQQLHVFDKQKSRVFETGPRNVAGETDFYNYEEDGKLYTLEYSLSELESQAGAIFSKILDADSLQPCGHAERSILAAFFSVQLVRTKSSREQWRIMPEQLRQKLQQTARSDDVLKAIEVHIRTLDPNELARESTSMVAEAPKHYAVHFSNKVWFLAGTSSDVPFHVCDNPLTLQNMTDTGLRGNLGVAVPGIEIYFPISPTRSFVMWCPSLVDICKETVVNLRQMMQLAPQMVLPEHQNMRMEERLSAIVKGAPFQYCAEAVKNLNSLQVMAAERFIFSSNDNFDLAQEMLAAEPHLRGGPRMRMS